MPNSFEPNSILDVSREKQNFNVHFKSKGAATADTKFGPPIKFEYISESYDAFLESLKKDKVDSKDKQKKLHGGKDFYPTHPKPKGKYENPFDEGDKEYLFPFLSEDDPYEAAKDEVFRHKWIEESKNLYGDFKPSYKEASLEMPGRTLFMHILEDVKKVLLADWNDVNFVIGTNPEEMIEIKFE